MRAPLSGCEAANSSPRRHEAGHLVLSEADLLAPELGEREVGDLEVEGGGFGSRAHAAFFSMDEVEEALVLVLLPAQPVCGVDALGLGGLGLEPRLDRVAEVGLTAQTEREAHVAEADVELRQQLAQRTQALKLLGPVEAVAAGRALGLEKSDALDVAKHARRPSGRLRRFVDRQSVHSPATLSRLCQGLLGIAGRRSAQRLLVRAPTAKVAAAPRRLRRLRLSAAATFTAPPARASTLSTTAHPPRSSYAGCSPCGTRAARRRASPGTLGRSPRMGEAFRRCPIATPQPQNDGATAPTASACRQCR